MNTIKVVCNDESVMELCDKYFDVVNHWSETNQKSQYSGEFIVMDSRSEQFITDKVKEIKQNKDKIR